MKMELTYEEHLYRQKLIRIAQRKETDSYKNFFGPDVYGEFPYPKAPPLHRMLENISKYEWERNRPALSVLIVRSGLRGRPGTGVFELGEKLTGIKKDVLKKDEWDIEQKKEIYATWTCEGAPDFFAPDEVIAYHELAGHKYNDKDLAAVAIREPIIGKVRYWQEQVANRLGWSYSNISDSWQSFGNVKKYIWGPIYRPTDENLGVFFTVDCQGEEKSLKLRLGYQFGDNSSFNKQQLTRLEEITKSDHPILSVSPSMLTNYSWLRLINESIQLVAGRMTDYTRAVSYVRGAKPDQEKLDTEPAKSQPNGQVEEDDGPIDPTGSGRNFAALAQRKHEIGEGGEYFVMSVLESEYPDGKVSKMVAGSRYDLKVEKDDGRIVEVEVKTTSSLNESTDFFISQYELDYAKQTDNEYVLIRVTGIDEGLPKIAYRLTKDQLLARERWVTGYLVSGRSRTIKKDDA